MSALFKLPLTSEAPLTQFDVALPNVRALADGVNPVTGEAYPEQSPYAEPRTLRALFSAVDLMNLEAESAQ